MEPVLISLCVFTEQRHLFGLFHSYIIIESKSLFVSVRAASTTVALEVLGVLILLVVLDHVVEHMEEVFWVFWL